MRIATRVPAFGLSLALILALPGVADARGPDHGGAAMGGAVAGLVCGGSTLFYARMRAGGREARADDPMLWHQTEGPEVLGAFFGEHALVGGLTGAFGNGPRAGFIVGGAITCTLDVGWIIASEILSANQEPGVALLERGNGGWRLAIPPVAVRRDGVYASLLAIRF